MSNLLRMLIAGTGLLPGDLLTIIADAPRRYKLFEIPKRSGGRREIAQPARELKLLQRVFLDEFLVKQPLHHSASAYKRGRSIRDNAFPHAESSSILKMDFENFFPSFTSSDWQKYCRDNRLLDDFDVDLSSKLLFRKIEDRKGLFLSIGAPTSPTLSNILMRDFDKILYSKAQSMDIRYTRYADDMTFSADKLSSLKQMHALVESTVRKLKQPKLVINAKKTHFISSAQRRTVTGLVISNEGRIGIGRDQKRKISSKVYHAIKGDLSPEEAIRLAGYLSYVNVVEPEFLDTLSLKYGSQSLGGVRSLASKSYDLKKFKKEDSK